jgi:hypothetical protein
MGSACPLRRAFVPRQRQGLRVVTIPSAGHFLPEEAPGEVFKLAKGWLESSGSDRRRRSRVAGRRPRPGGRSDGRSQRT